MKFKTKAALKLAKMTGINLASQALDDITIHFLDGDELVEGIEVFEMDDQGEYTVVPDGSYSWGDKTVVVSDGVVESILENKSAQLKRKMRKQKMKNAAENPVEDVEKGSEDLAWMLEVVKTLVDEVEKLGGDLSQVKEEVKFTKKELKMAKQNSNRDFASPHLTRVRSNDRTTFDANKELEKFGIK